MAEIIVPVVLEVVKCLFPCMRSEISHLCKYKRNFENLKEEVQTLEGIITNIQHKVDEAKRNGEEIEENVQKWLEEAKKMIVEEAVKFTENEETAANKRCFKGLCPDMKTRHQLSKEAVTQLAAVVRHREAGSFDSISYRTSPKDPRLSNKNYKDLKSRVSILNDILGTISNLNFNIIGIYGMGGVGKTTIAKEVAKQAERKRLFDRVVFASVNQCPDIKNIQGEIADQLGLTFATVETLAGRAGMLCERLKKEKNILVILDDIWASLDMEAVGIPLGVDHKGCKVLLTARSVDVLSGKMDSQQNFEVRTLNDKEAWRLFKEMAGNYIEGNEFRLVATEIVKKCAGLPIALVTVAKALRNKRLFAWKDALQQLRRSCSESIEGIHATIELSYNYLESEELKKTFLLVGYSHCRSIDRLLSYGMGLGLFEGINKMEEAQDRVHTLVQSLKDSCMLLDSDNFFENFSMHDVVRDASISIATRKHLVFTTRNVPDDQCKWPDESMLKSYSSLVIDNVIQSSHELPAVLECPQLKLFRAKYRDSFEFPKDFFARMTELRVLDLSSAITLSLPSSVCLLTNLRTIHLHNFSSNGLAVIGDLRKLEILRLRCYGLNLPKEVGQLTRLKSLDLRGCSSLVIQPNIISHLLRLEELYFGCFAEGEVPELINNAGINAVLVELNHLSYLTALQVQIKDVNTLPRNLSLFEKLERYKILVGDWPSWELEDRYKLAEISRIFKFKNTINANIYFDVWNIMQLRRIESLFLDGLLDEKNFLYGSYNEGFSQLKDLEVKNNPNLSCIVECSNNNNVAMIEFGQLRSLVLHSLPQLSSFSSISTIDMQQTLFNVKVSLPNLGTLVLHEIYVERIWQKQVVALSCGIQNLTRLVITICPKLRCLFSSSIASSFDRLKHLEIGECPLLEEIVVLEDGLREERTNAMFPKLEFLLMRDLENISKFCSVEDRIEFPSLETLMILKCPELKEFVVKIGGTDVTQNPTPFFSEKVSFPSLEKIFISRMDNLKMIVHPQQAHQVLLHKLKSMRVERCHNLKSLTLCEVDSHLEKLHISGCGLEEIFCVGDKGSDRTNRLVFPTVISLRLFDLTNLTTLFPPEQPVSKVFPNLKQLFVREKSVATLLQQFSEDFLCKLEYIVVYLDEATVISSIDFLQRFVNMKRFEARGIPFDEGYSESNENGIVINNLNKCSHLKHILKEVSNMNNLVDLRVEKCDHLINLVSSSTSFENLTTFVVWDCKGLTNIITASTAKSLVRLREMSILRCNNVIEIVVDEGDAAKDEIVFKELKKLFLSGLKSLTSFCSGSCTFKFPSLEILTVEECPKMKTFSGGEISTPKLHKVRQNMWGGDGCWKDNLNTIIQHLHEEREKNEEESDTRTDVDQEDAKGSGNEKSRVVKKI